MNAKQLRKALAEGKSVDVGLLVDLLERLEKALDEANQKIAELAKANAELAKANAELAKANAELARSNKLDQAFSVDSHEKRVEPADEKKKNRRIRNKALQDKLGRKPNDAKLQAAVRTESVFPNEFPKDQCVLSHTRPVWRLEKNKAVIVAYEVWMHKPTKTYGKIPGVIGRSGYGLEFILAVAYQVYSLGLSLDKVVSLTQFFQDLKIGKSQIDSMLNQLARHLEGEFDNLCSLTANSMILHADETSWSIRSVWAFITEKARVLLHGVHKDAETLEAIINPAVFGGLVISDDAAVYGRFSKVQKCWAHLLRKAVRICLLDPENKQFELLRDGLFEIYRSAKRLKSDGRYSDDGRYNATLEIQDRLHALICPECEKHDGKKYDGALEEYRLLILEILKLSVDDALFTFVTTPAAPRPNGTELAASGTNNEAERTLRPAAKARNTDQASKTLSGARRRTIIVSTMESIRCYVKGYTLALITDELLSWQIKGISCFERTLQSIEDCTRSRGILAKLYPMPQAA
jgi:hypothetical protein